VDRISNPASTGQISNPAYRGTPVVLCLAFLAAGCDLPGKPDPEERPKFPAQVQEFSKLYKENCSGCHGNNGKKGPAPMLNDDLFRASISPEVLTTILTSGRKGTQMPGFLKENGGTLTKDQIQILVHEIKGTRYKVEETGVSEHARLTVTPDDKPRKFAWGVPEKLPQDAPPYQAPKGETGDKERGIKLFAVACADCHGKDGKGTKDIGAVHDHAFLGLVSDQVLRRVIITGRPDLKPGMPRYDDRNGRAKEFKPLTSQDVADLVAVLRYWRQGGTTNGK
jgi:mono/diheme cytochrome c family protein